MERKMSGKLFTLTKRRKIFYVRFKLPGGGWSTAKSTGETVKSRAEKWAINYLNAGQIVRRENVTLAAFAKDFFSYNSEWALNRRVAGIRNTQRQCIEKTRILNGKILPALGKAMLTDIDKIAVRRFRNNLFQDGLSGSSINHSLSCLKAILEAAEDQGLIQSVPRIERAADRPKSRGILTIEEVRKIFNIQWADFRAYVANLAAASTGLRRGELQALVIDDIKGEYITVRRSWDEQLRVLNETTKTGRARTVIIPENLRQELNRLIDVNPFGKQDSFVFFSKREDKPVEGIILTRGLYRALKAIGISEEQRKARNITFHSWRHWLNSLLINAQIPVAKVQSITGHITADMTQKNYYHPDDMGDVLAVVNGSLFPQTGK